MNLNSNILFQQQTPDIMGRIGRAAQNANALGQQARQQAMDNFLLTSGGAVRQGNPDALNALAAFDPQAALGVESARQGMTIAGNEDRRADERLDLARQTARAQMLNVASQMDARQRQAQMETIQTGLNAAAMATTEPMWNATLQRFGLDPNEYPWQMRDTIIAQAMGAAEALDFMQQQEGGAQGQILSPEQAAAMGLPEGTWWNPGDGGKPSNLAGGGQTINVNTGPNQSKFQDEMGKIYAQTFGGLLESGVTAPARLARIDELDRLLAESPSGLAASLTAFAGDLGIQTDGTDTVQAARAIINALIPQQRPPGSGPMSDRDVEMFKASLPRLINSQEGNRIIISTMRGLIEYERKQADIANRVAAGEMDPTEGYRALAGLQNPLRQFRSEAGESVTIGGNDYIIREVTD